MLAWRKIFVKQCSHRDYWDLDNVNNANPTLDCFLCELP